jgi:cytochrome c oxidase subunit 3
MSGLSRSIETARAADRDPTLRRSLPNGMWAIVLLIATEGALFAALLVSYWYLRFASVEWPLGGIEPPDVVVPLVLAAVLASTSVPMLGASLAARAGRVRLTWLLVFAAFFVQSGYLAFELHGFFADLDTFTPTENAYGSIYFTLLGADHAHVFVGLLLSLWLLVRLLWGLTAYRAQAVRVVSWYWHFANAVTLAVIVSLVSAGSV